MNRNKSEKQFRVVSGTKNSSDTLKEYTKITISYKKLDNGVEKDFVEEKYSEKIKFVEIGKEQSDSKDQEKSDSYSQKKPNSLILKEIIEQESAAVNFVNNELVKMVEASQKPKDGEVMVEGVWLTLAFDYLSNLFKEKALIFIAKTLEEIKEKAIPWAIELTTFALTKLQDYLYKRFEDSHNEEEREYFKDRIIKEFPESNLAKKLLETNE